jgi:HD-GYP domain-containing protein (c-di-GMP phosphodiesterase class II)
MSNVSAYVAIKDISVNIPDVYNSDLFDFTGPKEFDNRTKYRTKSMLVIPMKNHENDVIGVLQLINAKDIQTGDVISFSESFEELTHSLASQAAVAITNVKLIQDMENLFNSFVKVMATAIDEKSPVTAGHIRRVAELTCKMANTITEKKEGPFANVYFDKDQLNELKIAGWMHDIGKVATPVQIIEKGKKLESIFDRVNYIALRFHYITKTVEVEAYKKKVELLEQKAPKEEIDNLERETEKKLQEIEESTNLVMICNEPGEYLEDEKIEKLGKLAKMTYKEGEKQLPLLSEDELLNLSIRKGSITEAERQKMQDHAAISLKMLEQIPFTKKLKNIPLFAGAHHEYLNGKGYPKGLKGDEIPLEGRILAVVDVAEALSAQDRPYKKAMPMEQVYKILGFMVKDGELDPQVVDLIIKEKVLERYLEETEKALKS